MWRMVKEHPEANTEYPFAIVQKGRVVALVKGKFTASRVSDSKAMLE
jgi:hypothetical protein